MFETPLGLVGTVLALWALRIQVLHDLHLDFMTGLNASMWIGAVSDVGVLLILWGIAQLVAALLRLPRKLTGTLLFLLAMLASLGETIYFRFFHSPLFWWVVRDHLGDAFVARESAVNLADSVWILAAVGVFLGTWLVWMFRRERHFPGLPRRKKLATAFLWIAVGLFVRQSPTWTGHFHPSLERNLMNSNLLVRWFDELTLQSRMGRGRLAADWRETRKNLRESAETLAAIRTTGATHPAGARSSSPVALAAANAAPATDWPLVKPFSTDPSERRALRRALGLPEEGPIHVFFVFLESVRDFEFRHPELGDVALPNLRRLVAAHGIRFNQGYANAFTAAQTVRGQFATFCSMYPNPLGEAPYLNFPTLRISCLAEEFRKLGYSTNWFNSHRKEFNNKNVFETLHGMDRFFDMDYYLSQGIRDFPHQPFGLRDKPFFDVTLAKIRELEAAGKPLFANILTTSTHHPPAFIEEGALPAHLDSRLIREGMVSYRNMLTQYRYSDSAAASFVEALLDDPKIGPRSLVVLLGDHSHSVLPEHEPSALQRSEIFFRIPMAILTAHPKEVRTFDEPIHQIDLAPMAAAIAGIEGQVTWQGHNPLGVDSHGRLIAKAGSPWLYQDSKGIAQYRTSDRICVEIDVVHGRRCYSTREADGRPSDPLYWTDEEAEKHALPSENSAEREKYTRALQATQAVIEWDGMFTPR